MRRTVTTRSPFETHAAAFWQTNPAANYNAIARRFVDQLSLDVADSARLFALLDLSAADALINVWNDKYYWNFWRPMTAIRQGGHRRQSRDAADASWKPLFDPSVTDPAIIGVGRARARRRTRTIPSGATGYASASMNAFEAFFGTDEMTFYATSSRFPGEQRVFITSPSVTNEVLEARIWAGIHFRNPDVQAANLGHEVVDYVHTHWFAEHTEPRIRGAAFGPLHARRCHCARRCTASQAPSGAGVLATVVTSPCRGRPVKWVVAGSEAWLNFG